MELENKKFSEYLKEKFGERIHKISLDANLSCPNFKNPCIYCNNSSFSYAKNLNKVSLKTIEEQFFLARDFVKKRFLAKKFIIYFQTNTNTFAPLDKLKSLYDIVKISSDIVGLSIATRPDAIDEKKLDLINSYAENYEVWIEYGLQSANDKTLDFIQRGHKYIDFCNAVKLTQKLTPKVKIGVHIIVGLPDETEKDIFDTIDKLNFLKIDGIKIHPLHIVKGTKLEKIYLDQLKNDDNSKKINFNFLKFEKYIEILVKIFARLNKNIIILGYSSYCPKNILVSPEWVSIRDKVILAIKNY